jgi:hypothetical protein
MVPLSDRAANISTPEFNRGFSNFTWLVCFNHYADTRHTDMAKEQKIATGKQTLKKSVTI